MPASAEALPGWASGLRVGLPTPYVYRSRLKRAAAAALDFAGGLLLAPAARPLPWSQVRRLAVLRLDHLGDLLHAQPALIRLRQSLPKAQIDLWVGPWGQELASLFPMVDAVRVTPASWFKRPERVEWPWTEIRDLGRALKAGAYDAGIDLRGDLRHHLALRLSGMPWRVGQTLTAGGFLLTHAGRWDASLHEQEQGMALLEQAGLSVADKPWRGPRLRLSTLAVREAAAVARRLKVSRGPILIQAACGTQAKRWSPERWGRLIRRLPQGRSVVLFGSAAEREEMRVLAALSKGRAKVAAGQLSLSGLAALLKTASLLISVDSGPAHLAAVQGVPVLSLFSGTNRASQWAPRGKRVRVLQAAGFPCSPCELSVCPFGNACMAALEEDQVLGAALSMLRR